MAPWFLEPSINSTSRKELNNFNIWSNSKIFTFKNDWSLVNLMDKFLSTELVTKNNGHLMLIRLTLNARSLLFNLVYFWTLQDLLPTGDKILWETLKGVRIQPPKLGRRNKNFNG